MLLTVRDVAGKLNVSVGCVYGLIGQGKIPCHRVGTGRGTIRVSEEDVSTYLAACRVESSREGSSAVKPTTSGRPFKFLDGDRLQAAWQQQGVPVDLLDERNVRTSES